MDTHTPQQITEMYRQINEVYSKNNLNSDRETLLNGLLSVIKWHIIKEDEYILLDCLREVCKEFEINVKVDEQFIRDLKTRYFEELRKALEKKIKIKREESLSIVSIKQLYYLAATVFAESILNKPVPASLIFEILRCAGMEEEKNFPNRYYFLKQLEERGLVRKITVVNSKAEQLYCSTEEGKKIVNGTEAFNKLIELKEKILNDNKVRKLIEIYSKEAPKIEHEKPAFLKNGRIIRENDNSISVLIYNDKVVNLTRDELEKIDSSAKSLGRFKHSELVEAVKNGIKNADFKARAYIVYAYAKGLIDIVEGRSKGCVYERKVN